MTGLRVDAPLLGATGEAGAAARRLEKLGYDGAFTFEGPHDPFLPLALAAESTQRIELSTAIAVAFARNPMLLANLGYDLHELSRGRFILGLGSQIRPHIERRFAMPWSRPAARMREMVLAVRAIWRSWQEREKLDFRGEFYTHTLMTPFFDPGPSEYGLPRIFVAGVGPKMTRIAGEVADGFFVHPFHSDAYLAETILPELERGAQQGGRPPGDLEVACQVLVVTGRNDEEWDAARGFTRSQIAFYGSTPAYRGVLDRHGRGDLHLELNRLSKRGQWMEMAALVDDELMETIAICGPPETIAPAVRARCGAFARRVSLVAPYRSDPETWVDVVAALHQEEGA